MRVGDALRRVFYQSTPLLCAHLQRANINCSDCYQMFHISLSSFSASGDENEIIQKQLLGNPLQEKL